MSEILGETQAGELPARMGWKEISISRPDVTGGCHAGAAAQHELAGHELAVGFADRAGCRPEAWIRRERAARPLPDPAVHLLPSPAFPCRLPPQPAGPHADSAHPAPPRAGN